MTKHYYGRATPHTRDQNSRHYLAGPPHRAIQRA
jgi:hypothetical protein